MTPTPDTANQGGRYALAIVAVLLCGCTKDEPKYRVRYEWAVKPEHREAAAAWILKTVEAANPHSDEEPEDNIAQAEETAKRMFGSQVPHLVVIKDGGYRVVPEWDLTPADRAMLDSLMATGARP